MSNPLISIIIPVYNSEKTLASCVGSIVQQTYSPLEIILVNDGSKDDSAVVCEDLARKEPCIKVIHQENRGPNSARNKGIEASHGDFLVFVDSDDEFYSVDTLAINMQFFLKNDAIDIVSFPQYRESESIEKNSVTYATKEAQFIPTLLEDKKEIFTNWYNGRLIDGHFPGKIFRRSLFDGHKLIETIRFTEDHYEIPELCSRCRMVQISGVGGYVYKYNAFSAIHSEYTSEKRYGQFLSELKIYEYLQYFQGVDADRALFYEMALENAYYLMDTSYRAEVLEMVQILGRRYRCVGGVNGQHRRKKLLMIMTVIFGYRLGFDITHKLAKLILC